MDTGEIDRRTLHIRTFARTVRQCRVGIYSCEARAEYTRMPLAHRRAADRKGPRRSDGRRGKGLTVYARRRLDGAVDIDPGSSDIDCRRTVVRKRRNVVFIVGRRYDDDIRESRPEIGRMRKILRIIYMGAIRTLRIRIRAIVLSTVFPIKSAIARGNHKESWKIMDGIIEELIMERGSWIVRCPARIDDACAVVLGKVDRPYDLRRREIFHFQSHDPRSWIDADDARAVIHLGCDRTCYMAPMGRCSRCRIGDVVIIAVAIVACADIRIRVALALGARPHFVCEVGMLIGDTRIEDGDDRPCPAHCAREYIHRLRPLHIRSRNATRTINQLSRILQRIEFTEVRIVRIGHKRLIVVVWLDDLDIRIVSQARDRIVDRRSCPDREDGYVIISQDAPLGKTMGHFERPRLHRTADRRYIDRRLAILHEDFIRHVGGF